MRVTHLTPSGQLGGAEAVILDCIGVGNRQLGAQSSIVALGAGPLLAAAQGLGARTLVVEPPAALSTIGESFSSLPAVLRALFRPLFTFPGFFRRFSAAVGGLLPDVIHSHGVKTHVLAALLPRRVPVVWHLHDYVGTRAVSSRLLPFLARRCALAIAVSESVARDARESLSSALPVVVVHNAVDCDRFTPDGSALDLDQLCGLPPAAAGCVRIGFPATFARWKGHEVFLKALAMLGRAGVRGYVIGGALYRTGRSQWSLDELRSKVAALGLTETIGFTGLVDDMPSAYRALDIVVHASTRPEPFGLVIAEGMACGRAVVAAPTGGAVELFVPEEHALAARSGDAEALAQALRRLVDAPELRAQLGARARAHVVDSFSRDRFARSLEAALASVSLSAAAHQGSGH